MYNEHSVTAHHTDRQGRCLIDLTAGQLCYSCLLELLSPTQILM